MDRICSAVSSSIRPWCLWENSNQLFCQQQWDLFKGSHNLRTSSSIYCPRNFNLSLMVYVPLLPTKETRAHWIQASHTFKGFQRIFKRD